MGIKNKRRLTVFHLGATCNRHKIMFCFGGLSSCISWILLLFILVTVRADISVVESE